MAWAWAVVVVLGAGLPFAGWRLSRRLESRRQPAAALGPHRKRGGQVAHRRAPACRSAALAARDAVLYGRAVRDQALRPAARGVASAVLRGELRIGRGVRIAGVVLLAEGVALIAPGVVVFGVPGSWPASWPPWSASGT